MLRQDQGLEELYSPDFRDRVRTFWWQTGYWLALSAALGTVVGCLVAHGGP